MKKILLIAALFLFVFTLTACEGVCIGPECILTAEELDEDPVCTADQTLTDGVCVDNEPFECPEVEEIEGTVVENAIEFPHISGHGDVDLMNAFILLEIPSRDYVRYQITYLSCTCRNADVNYWQVAFVEINKSTNDLRTISFEMDSTDHYIAGMWGDSSPTPDTATTTGRTKEEFAEFFIPWLIGKSLTDLEGILVFTNDVYHEIENTSVIAEQDLIDDFAGSSVSTNNMIRVMKELLKYHEERY